MLTGSWPRTGGADAFVSKRVIHAALEPAIDLLHLADKDYRSELLKKGAR